MRHVILQLNHKAQAIKILVVEIGKHVLRMAETLPKFALLVNERAGLPTPTCLTPNQNYGHHAVPGWQNPLPGSLHSLTSNFLIQGS